MAAPDRVESAGLERIRTRKELMDAKSQETVALALAVLFLIVIFAGTVGLAFRVFCFAWGRC